MRRYWVVALAVLTLLGVLSPPAFAQAPAPKVSITGFIASYTYGGQNHLEHNFHRTGDTEWATNTRARFFFNTEVGKVQGVLGLEIDSTWGQTGATDTTALNANTIQQPGVGSSAFDNGVDSTGNLEVKHLYVRFPAPLVPIPTVVTIGAQPYAATWKLGALLTSDTPGVSWVTTFTPNVKWNFLYTQLEEDLIGPRPPAGVAGTQTAAPTACVAATAAGIPNNAATVTAGTGCGRGDDFSIVTSVEVTPMKGLEVRPIYGYLEIVGASPSLARHAGVGGVAGPVATVRKLANGSPQNAEYRHTIGAEARWRSGPWTLQPTFLYQFGTRETDNPFLAQTAALLAATSNKDRVTEADISAWFFDIDGGYRIGPWLFEARYAYITGNRPKDQLHKDVNYFQPIQSDSAYWADWGDFIGAGQVGLLGGGIMAGHVWPSYERYGRQGFAVSATYSVMPELDVDLVVSPVWTARSIDTDGTKTNGFMATPTNPVFTCNPNDTNTAASARGAGCRGDASYIGTDLSFKLVWRFAPGLQARVGTAYLFSGDALDITEIRSDGIREKRSARDAWYSAAMVQYNF